MTKQVFIDVANAPERSDEELYVDFLQSQDNKLLGDIFRRNMALVFGVCMKYMGEKHEAQDATMEIFERLLTHHIKTEIKSFRAYLYVLSKNHCLMKKRGEKVIHMQITEADMESAMDVHPIDETEQNENQLKKCLSELKDLQKTCVELFYLSQKSYLEISTKLRVTINSVKSNIQNGKRNLKLCLEHKK